MNVYESPIKQPAFHGYIFHGVLIGKKISQEFHGFAFHAEQWHHHGIFTGM